MYVTKLSTLVAALSINLLILSAPSASAQLTATANLNLTIHRDLALGEQKFRVRTRIDEVRQLQKLPEPNGVSGDFDLVHIPSLAEFFAPKTQGIAGAE